jgi:hypothetical protein
LLDRGFAAHPAGTRRKHVALELGWVHIDPGSKTHREARLVNALDVLNFGRLKENAFSEKKTPNEVVVVPWRAHHNRKRGIAQSNLYGFLDRNGITFLDRRTGSVSRDRDVTTRSLFTG